MAGPTIRFTLKPLVERATLVAAVLLIMSHFLSATAGTQSMFSVVISASMEPQVQRGDVIIWVPATAEEMEEGDVAIYEAKKVRDATVSHRVEKAHHSKGQVYLTTKGDNNDYTDQSRGEPLVSNANLLGKALTVGDDKRLFRIPYAGWIILLPGDIFNVLTENIGGEESSTFQMGVLLPMLGSVGMLVFAAVVLNPRKDEKADMVQLIFGPENVRLRRVFAYALTMFTIFLLSTALFAHEDIDVAMGVRVLKIPREEQARLNMDNMMVNETKSRDLPILAPALLGVKGIVYAEGGQSEWIDLNGTLFYVEARERQMKEIHFTAPEGTSRGTYNNATIYIYSSPYWVLLPDTVMEPIVEKDPFMAVLIFDVMSAVIMSILSVVILALIAYITDAYHRWKVYATWQGIFVHPKLGRIYKLFWGPELMKFARGERDPLAWVKDLDWYRFDPTRPISVGVAASSVGLLLVYYGRTFEGIFISAALAGVVAYLAGCTYRPQVILAGVTAEAISVGLMLFSMMSAPFHLEPLILLVFLAQVGAIIALLFTVLLLPVAYLSFLTAYGLHQYWLKYDPERVLQINSDL